MENKLRSIVTDFNFNAIYVIESFNDNEHRCGKELYEDTLYWTSVKNEKFESYYKDISTFKDLEKLFFDIQADIRTGVCPILHFDMHGNDSGIVLKNGYPVGWDYFRAKFQDINIRLKNNLFVGMSTCCGANVIKVYDVTQPCSIFGFLGFVEKIGFKFSLNFFRDFYTQLIENESIDSAIQGSLKYTEKNEHGFLIENCVHMFIVGFSYYIQMSYASRRKIDARSEKIRNDLIQEGYKPPNRKEIKKFLLEKDKHFEKLKNTFFMIDRYPENEKRFPYKYSDLRVLFPELPF